MAIDLRSKQAEFAAYIRDPSVNPMPADVAPRRMAMYRELFFNNIDGFLSSNFPVLRKILNDSEWLDLAQDFFATHHCRTPHFSEISEEFLDYLQHRHQPNDYPFLLELAHYEWVEMALAISKAEVQPADSTLVENLSQQNIALSPLAWPLAYRYPVQSISADFLPLTPPEQPTYLIVYRDRDDDVRFLQSTSLTYALLQILGQHPSINCVVCLNIMADRAPHLDKEMLHAEGLLILQEMARKGIIMPAGNA